MKYKLLFSPESKEDAKAIRLYLRQFSVKAPARFKSLIQEKLDKVRVYPQMYTTYRYQPKYRCIPIENYLLFYEVNDQEKVIYIYRILHGAQDTRSYL
jgi:toxin ParE1/3/4